jgi:XTP/dITP diphosphohydrolase
LNNDLPDIQKELGDVLLHIVFYAKIGSEKAEGESYNFDIKDVLHSICDKLVARHPHIYGDFVADTEEAVKQNWEKLKLKEGNKSVLSGVPASLPALVKAMRIQEKARGVGFDWDEKQQVWAKVEEELHEFKENFNIETADVIDQKEAEGEFGDLLFSLVNYSRFVDINPETALERTNKKFINRFQYLEEASKADGKSLSDMTLDEMDIYWNRAKEMGV